ncbi:MAG: transposase [Candidatus Nitrosotenuis sp.]
MGEFRCIRHFQNQGGDHTIINIGIDVHKKKCVATLKGQSRQVLQQTFYNNSDGIAGFVDSIKKYGNARAVCESTANYWIRLHNTLEENGINTILAHPAKTKMIAQAKKRQA